jgi:hypothetical protein
MLSLLFLGLGVAGRKEGRYEALLSEQSRGLLTAKAAGMMPHMPVKRTVNNQGDGSLFGREDCRYEP